MRIDLTTTKAAEERNTRDVRRAIHAAVKAAQQAERAASGWADTIRQGAEGRLGVDATDERAWREDAEYGDALRRFGELRAVREELQRQLSTWEEEGVR